MTTLYVATASGLYSLGATQGHELEGRDVNALHVDVAGRRWALLDQHELWHDTDHGWEAAARSAKFRLNCLVVHEDKVWVGASRARLLQLQDGDLIPSASFDAAPGREDWFTPWGGPPDVRSIAVNDRYLFANVHVGGILRAGPEGSSWEPTIEIGSDVHEVVTDPKIDGLVVAASARGLARSRDDADTWEFAVEGLHASYARAVVAANESLFMTASQGPFGGHAAVYRAPMEGAVFRKCQQGLPEWFDGNIDSGCLSTSGASVAFGTEDGRVFASEDEGDSWNEVAGDLPPIRWVEFGGR